MIFLLFETQIQIFLMKPEKFQSHHWNYTLEYEVSLIICVFTSSGRVNGLWKDCLETVEAGFLYFNVVFFYTEFENVPLPYIERFSLVVCWHCSQICSCYNENRLNTKLTIYRQVHYLSWNHFTFFLFSPLLINKYTRESTYDVQLYYMCYVLQTNIHSDTSMMNHIVL